MNEEVEGKIIIIVSASGAGKSTLIKKLKIDFPDLLESVSFTTRPIREGEVDGVHYNFIDVETFLKMKDSGEFLEWANVHGKYYGTSKKFVEEKIQDGQNILFDLDVQGTDSFKTYFKQKAHAIFIAPPSLKELESRLRGRATDSETAIHQRILDAKQELLRSDDYDYKVYNDEIEIAYVELKNIVNEILGN
ncbi:MAG: guanylate kinase [Halobacteriovoraceae bacterium]|nr:guanylate kinase [Halobacteriovoraceae bacterium]